MLSQVSDEYGQGQGESMEESSPDTRESANTHISFAPHPKMELLIQGFSNIFYSTILPMDIIDLIVAFTTKSSFDPRENLLVIARGKCDRFTSDVTNTLSINLATESPSKSSYAPLFYDSVQCVFHNAPLPISLYGKSSVSYEKDIKYSMFIHVDKSSDLKFCFDLTTYNPLYGLNRYELPDLYYDNPKDCSYEPNIVYNAALSSLYSLHDHSIDRLRLDKDKLDWEPLCTIPDNETDIGHGITCMIQDKFIAIINRYDVRLFALNCNALHYVR